MTNEIIDSTDSLQRALNKTAEVVFEKAKEAKRPLYYTYYDYPLEYWPNRKSIFIECTEEVANKLGIPLDELIKQLEN